MLVHRAPTVTELRGEGNAAQVAGDGFPHLEVMLHPVEEKDEAMAAAEHVEPALEIQGEVATRETVRRFQCGGEGEAAFFMGEEAEEGSVAAVAGAEAADEGGGGHEAAPALADEGGAGQGGRRRGEAEEDI